MIKKTAVISALILSSIPALAAGVESNLIPVPAAHVAGPVTALAVIELYEGEMTVGGKTVSLRLRLSTEDYDQYKGDPDMSQGVYVSRQGRLSEDGQPECSTAWERNGDWLHECSGYFMVGIKDAVEKGRTSGDVFNRLDRFDPETGDLRVQPVGHFTLHKVVAAPAGAVAAVPVGSNVHPYADDLGGDVTSRVDAYLAKGREKVLADFSTCNERFDDCAGLRFVFSQLTVDFASKTVKLGSETVATLSYDAQTDQAIKDGRFYFGEDGLDHAYEVRWAAGWRLAYQIDGSGHVSVSLAK